MTNLRASRAQAAHEQQKQSEMASQSQQPIQQPSGLRRSGSASALARSSRRDRDRILAGAAVSVFVFCLALLIVTPLVSGSLFHRETAAERAADHADTTAQTLKAQGKQDYEMIREQAKDVYGRFKDEIPGIKERAQDYLHDSALAAKDRATEAAAYAKAKASDAAQLLKEKFDPLPEPTLMDKVKTKVNNVLHPGHPQTVEERVRAKVAEAKQDAREYAQDAAAKLKEKLKTNTENLGDTLDEKATAMKNKVLGSKSSPQHLYERAKDKLDSAYESVKDRLSSDSDHQPQEYHRLTHQEYKARIRKLAHEAIEDALAQVEDEDRSTLDSIVYRFKQALHLNKE